VQPPVAQEAGESMEVDVVETQGSGKKRKAEEEEEPEPSKRPKFGIYISSMF